MAELGLRFRIAHDDVQKAPIEVIVLPCAEVEMLEDWGEWCRIGRIDLHEARFVRWFDRKFGRVGPLVTLADTFMRWDSEDDAVRSPPQAVAIADGLMELDDWIEGPDAMISEALSNQSETAWSVPDVFEDIEEKVELFVAHERRCIVNDIKVAEQLMVLDFCVMSISG